MKRLRMALLLMILSIMTLLLDLVRHSPVTMTLFLTVGFGSAGLAVVLFGLEVYKNFRFRVSHREDEAMVDTRGL